MEKVPDMVRSELRCGYSEVDYVIIDKILMASNIILLNIHKRLCEIFGCLEELAFVGKSVVAVGDLLQLPTIRASPIYTPYNNSFDSLFKLRDISLMCEINEVMRQHGGTDLLHYLITLG